MTRYNEAILPAIPTYDNCLITSCLKKICAKPTHGKEGDAITISKHIDEVKAELEVLNRSAGTEMSYPYLRAMEDTLPDAGVRYVVIRKDNMPALFCYFQLIPLTSQNFSFEKSKGFVKSIFSFFLDLKKVKVLISGNALRTETAGYCYEPTLLNKAEVAEVIASAAEKIAAEEHATAVILRDMPVPAQQRKWLAGIGYGTPWKDQVMTLDIADEWQDMTGYTTALTRKYKTRANKALAARSGIKIKEWSLTDLKQNMQLVNNLFASVADTQSFVLTTPGADHFVQLKEVYKDAFEIFAFLHEGKPVAFYTAFVNKDAYEVYYVGFDYTLNAEYQLYFNILFSGLERAIQLKKKQLKLGRTSFDAKASLGAKPADTDYYIKMVNIGGRAANWFINYFSAMEDAKWKLRNPFK